MSGKLAVIGLGYVGLPLAAAFAKVRPVIGFDISLEKINELSSGIDRTGEVGSDELAEVKESLILSVDATVLSQADIYIITVPTPVTSANDPDLSPLISACQCVGVYLKPGSLIIFESTVYPGCTEEICIPILERESGLKCDFDGCGGQTFDVGYSPERINPGDKNRRIIDIQKVVSGSNRSAANRVECLYDEIIKAGTCLASSIKVAEAAKVIENSQRDINVAFINELMMILDRMGISIYEVLDVAKTKWNFLDFTPGLVGGHCIGVDPYYLAHSARQWGVMPNLITAGRKINDGMSGYIVEKVLAKLSSNPSRNSKFKIGVLGLTFKENCPDIRNSKSLDVVDGLISEDCEVKIFDPVVDRKMLSDTHRNRFVDLNEFRDLDVLLILVPHSSFFEISGTQLESMGRLDGHLIVFDLKNILKPRLRSFEGVDWL